MACTHNPPPPPPLPPQTPYSQASSPCTRQLNLQTHKMKQASRIPADSPSVIAANNRSICSLNSINFYRAPTSPAVRAGTASFGYESCQRTRKTREGVNPNSDEFEFVSGKRFSLDDFERGRSQNFEIAWGDQQEQGKQQLRHHGGSLPEMAFAEDLLCNGQVLPLKLPPRLHSSTQVRYDDSSSIPSSPRSPSSILKIPFYRHSVWNDDFDPFMVALEKVKEEIREESHRDHRRCTSSLLSVRPCTPLRSDDSAKRRQHQYKQQHQMRASSHHVVESKGSKGETQLRGLQRLNTLPEPKVKTVEKTEDSGGGGSVQRLKTYIFRYASFGTREENRDEGKQKEQNGATWMPTFFQRLSFKFKGNADNTRKRKVNREFKMSLTQYRPRLTPCLGYGIRSPKNTT